MRHLPHIVIIATLGILAGCGGGGGATMGGASGGGGGDQTFTAGALTFTAKAGLQPLVSSGGNAPTTLFSVSNGTFSSVLANLPHSLNSTFIAFGLSGQVWTTDVGFTNQTTLTNNINTSYSEPSVNAYGKIAYTKVISGIHQIFVINGDGSGSTKISDGSSNDSDPSWTSNNASILFQRNAQIYTMTANGGSPTTLDDGTAADGQPVQAPNGTIAFVRLNTVTGKDEIWLMNANGTNKHVYFSDGSYHFAQPSFSPDSNRLLCVGTDSINPQFIDEGAIDLSTQAQITTPPSGANDVWPQFAPDGHSIIFGRNDSSGTAIIQAGPDGFGPKTKLTIPGGLMDRISWSPYIASKLLVGTGGSFGTTSSGVILAQQGDVITSMLNVVASSGATILINLDPQNAMVERITMSGGTGTIASLLYTNNFFANPLSVSTSNAKQIAVSYDSDGHVSLVLPASKMTATKPNTGSGTVYSGQFLGVYDDKGKNLAPGGASEVRVDSKTGKLVSLK